MSYVLIKCIYIIEWIHYYKTYFWHCCNSYEGYYSWEITWADNIFVFVLMLLEQCKGIFCNVYKESHWENYYYDEGKCLIILCTYTGTACSYCCCCCFVVVDDDDDLSFNNIYCEA